MCKKLLGATIFLGGEEKKKKPNNYDDDTSALFQAVHFLSHHAVHKQQAIK